MRADRRYSDQTDIGTVDSQKYGYCIIVALRNVNEKRITESITRMEAYWINVKPNMIHV